MAYYVTDENGYFIYDIKKHRYILTKEGFLNYKNINLDEALNFDGSGNIDKMVDTVLDRVSDILYTYIYSYALDKSKTEFELVFNQDLLDTLINGQAELLLGWLWNNKEPSYLFTNEPIKFVTPYVDTLLKTVNILYRGEILSSKFPSDWKDTKGVDW